jgi:hypothetical protein
MLSRILSLFLVVLVAVSAFAAYRLLEASLAAEVYRGRLAELSADYEQLRERYNEAVRRTAVTELRVEGGVLTVVIRTADGELQSLVSPFDPRKEIYVDYVVHEGRLWIRRLFDEDTPPGDGMLIDPRFVDVDWDASEENHGKAAYRSLGEGRWVVDVTGDGSLGLARRDPLEPIELVAPPPVRRYEPIETEVGEALGEIRAVEALEALGRQLRIRAG